MFNIFSKIKFIFKKPDVIVITGEARKTAKEAIFQILRKNFRIDKDVFIFETEDKEINKFNSLLNSARTAVLVVTNIGDIPPDKIFFAGERGKIKETRSFVKKTSSDINIVVNYDDETAREIGDFTDFQILKFGFDQRADISASDINLNSGTNFKINYKGYVVPVWLNRLFGKEQIYASLAAVSVGILLGLNLVEISQTLKDYQGPEGKMKLIKGIKNSWILDDSESASVFSMVEAITVLGKIRTGELNKGREGRKIAALGDILGIGKYTIEAHESIGEDVVKNADLLFTFGPRARFIAEGAKNKGMPLEKIFQYDTIEQGKVPLQNEIKEGDLILVDGSKEMKMEAVVKEIKGL